MAMGFSVISISDDSFQTAASKRLMTLTRNEVTRDIQIELPQPRGNQG
jgi:type III secretory pathway component EscU